MRFTPAQNKVPLERAVLIILSPVTFTINLKFH